MKTSIIALFAVSVLSACATTTKTVPVIEIQERRVEVPKSLLTCAAEPVAGSVWTSQKELGKFIVRLAEAGQDCRLKLTAVKKLVEETQ